MQYLLQTVPKQLSSFVSYQSTQVSKSFCEEFQLMSAFISSESRDQARKYDCVFCKEEFSCLQSRKVHIATHADPKYEH